MRVLKDQRGFGLLPLLAALVVIVVVGVVGYRVVNNTDTGPTDSINISSNSSSQQGDIKNKADLKKASQSLDNTSIDGSLNPDQLDSDLNDLL